MTPTKERLARMLDYEALPLVAARARAGEFDDYESASPTPQADLVKVLHLLDRPDLIARVRRGEFRASRAESDAFSAEQDLALRNAIERGRVVE